MKKVQVAKQGKQVDRPNEDCLDEDCLGEDCLGEDCLGEDCLEKAANDDFVEEQIGFPPYWKPEIGESFQGIVMARDDQAAGFERFVVQATKPVACYQGPADDAETVLVPAGQAFTLSVYAALPLERFLGVEVLVTAVQKTKIQGGRQSLWRFSLKVRRTVKTVLDAERMALAKKAREFLLQSRVRRPSAQITT